MSGPTWGIWVAEYHRDDDGYSLGPPKWVEFWLTDETGNDLTYTSEEAAAAACREWFGQVPEHMTVREYRR